MTKCISDILRIGCVANIVKDIWRIVREVAKQAGGPLKLKKAEGNTQRKGKGSQETIVVSFQFILIHFDKDNTGHFYTKYKLYILYTSQCQVIQILLAVFPTPQKRPFCWECTKPYFGPTNSNNAKDYKKKVDWWIQGFFRHFFILEPHPNPYRVLHQS